MKTTKQRLEAIRDDAEKLRQLAQEVNSYDGSLDYLEFHEFDDEFFNTYFENNPMEAVRATFFGDIQSWNDEYIFFNGYGNLESKNSYQVDQLVLESADEIIQYAEELAEAGNIDLDWILDDADEDE